MPDANQETVRLASKGPEGSRAGRWRVVVVNETGSASFPLISDVTTIGRGEDAGIRLDDSAASRKHAQFVLSAGAVSLVDLGSANGTNVRGRKLAANEQVVLSEGDAVELGTTLAVLQRDELSGKGRPWTLHTHRRFLELARDTKPPYALLRLEVNAPPGVAQEVLSAELSPHDSVASFGPGMFEILAPGRAPDAARSLMEKLSASLVKRGARVRAGAATAPLDGTDPDLLIAACSRPASTPAEGFVVRDDAMNEVVRLAHRVAPSNINVLILGETGAGKEMIATELHERSKRASGPFLKFNCGGFNENLLESELFGHLKGSFTSAHADKVGLLESAQGGTVFLDELGEMPPSFQVKLLRVLEDRKVRRVGANTDTPIDVRFIFATNADLEAKVVAGSFREDLFFRVNGISILIPPLRDRPNDILPLAQRFLAEAAKKDGRPVPEFSPEAIAAMRAFSWPGNVRQLKSRIDSAVVLSGDTVTPQALQLPVAGSPARASQPTASGSNSLERDLEALERRRVLEVLEQCGGNQTRAAEVLGWSRRTLVSRLQSYGLTKSRKRPEKDTGD